MKVIKGIFLKKKKNFFFELICINVNVIWNWFIAKIILISYKYFFYSY